MLFDFQRLLAPDEPGGGTGGGSDAAGGTNAGGTQAGSGGTGGAGGDAGGAAGADKGGSGQSSGDKAPDYKALHEQGQAEIVALKKGNDTLGQKYGSLKKMEDKAKLNPVAFATEILKGAGITKFSLGDEAMQTGTADFLDAEGKLDQKKLDSYLAQRDEVKERQNMQKNLAADTVIYNDEMAKKYPDWSNSQEERDAIRLAQIAGDIRPSELLHLAVRARHLPEILEAHKGQVIKEYQAELDKKRGASGAGGGTGRGETPLPEGARDIRTDPVEAEKVFKRLGPVVR